MKIDNPDLARALKLRDTPGRPMIEEDNPGDNISFSLKKVIQISAFAIM